MEERGEHEVWKRKRKKLQYGWRNECECVCAL